MHRGLRLNLHIGGKERIIRFSVFPCVYSFNFRLGASISKSIVSAYKFVTSFQGVGWMEAATVIWNSWKMTQGGCNLRFLAETKEMSCWRKTSQVLAL